MKLDIVTSSGRSQASRIVSELRRAIVACEFAPGDRLHIASLASKFEASPGAVREALSRLSGEHLVTAIDQRGFRVGELSLEDMLDLYTARAWVEERAVAESVKTGGEEWREALTLRYDRLLRFGPNMLINNEVLEAHEAFHRELLSACPGIWLKRVFDIMYRAGERYRFYVCHYLSDKRNSADEHKAIYEAAIAGDHELAGLLTRRHVEKSRDLLADALQEINSGDHVAKAG